MFKELIQSYVEDKNSDYAIVLNGAWGSGKTYYLDNLIKEEKDVFKDYEIVKVSLFGTSSLEDFYKRIFGALHKKIGGINNSFAGRLFAYTSFKLDFGIVSIGVDEGNFNFKAGSSASGAGIEINKNLNSKGKSAEELMKIVCGEHSRLYIFDDIERISFGDVNVKEIFGAITNLIEEDKAKVLLVCNEEKLEDEKTDYFLYKEKFVRHSYKFDPVNEYGGYDNIYNSLTESMSSLKKHGESILKIFLKAKIRNLRTLKFILSILCKILEFLEQNEKTKQNSDEILKHLINFIVIYTIEYKDGSKKEELYKLKPSRSPLDILNGGDHLDYIRAIYSDAMKDYYYLDSIADYIQTGYMQIDLFKKETENIAERLVNHQSEYEVYNNLINFAYLTDDEFNSKRERFVNYMNEGKYYFSDIINVYRLFQQLEKNGINVGLKDELFIEQAENRLTNYIENFDFHFKKITQETDDYDRRYNNLIEQCKKKNNEIKEASLLVSENSVYRLVEENKGEDLETKYRGDHSLFMNIEFKKLFEKLRFANNPTIHHVVSILSELISEERYEDNLKADNVESLENCCKKFVEEFKGQIKTVEMNELLNLMEAQKKNNTLQV